MCVEVPGNVDTMRPRQDDGNQILLREDALA
jgi:hypothetical protein